MFLTADGTVISFFEHSADDVEYVGFFFSRNRSVLNYLGANINDS